jgi:hypothetical protein
VSNYQKVRAISRLPTIRAVKFYESEPFRTFRPKSLFSFVYVIGVWQRNFVTTLKRCNPISPKPKGFMNARKLDQKVSIGAKISLNEQILI